MATAKYEQGITAGMEHEVNPANRPMELLAWPQVPPGGIISDLDMTLYGGPLGQAYRHHVAQAEMEAIAEALGTDQETAS
ncbi:hypothetical protein LDC_3155, partial [sediment metagenome]